MRGPIYRFRSEERGDLAAYIAAGLLLPFIIYLLFTTISLMQLGYQTFIVHQILVAGIQRDSIDGGLTPSLEESLTSQLQAAGFSSSSIRIRGTPNPVAYGQWLFLTVHVTTPFSLPGLHTNTVTLGGELQSTSNLPPVS